MKEPGETGYLTNFDDIWVYTTKKWVYIEKRVAVPASMSTINIRIESAAWGDRVGSVWYDNVSIRRVNPSEDIEIVEENNYYPFGLKHKGYNNVVNGTDHKYEYGNKELEEDLGLNTIAYGWRDYDPAIARFNKIDRFAGKFRELTPYHFGANNPIMNREIMGDSIIKVTIDDKSGYIKGESTLYIDHTFYSDTKALLTYAAENEIPIHINSSFRTNKKQGELTKKGSGAITPAKKRD